MKYFQQQDFGDRYDGFIASRQYDYDSWDFMTRSNADGDAICGLRQQHLSQLINTLDYDDAKFSFKGVEHWTKWMPLHSELTDPRLFGLAYDIHRSVALNEIVVESDYPTYEENYDAVRVIGCVLEAKGFRPHYYYSGGKSIHTHVFFDWKCLLTAEPELQEEILEKFKNASRFKKEFIEWIRQQIITAWGTNARQFDEQLVKSSHLIRMELSRNSKGFKTFLGYTYKDISMIPDLAHEKNGRWPRLGEIRLSRPNDAPQLLEEFLDHVDAKDKKRKASRLDFSLGRWLGGEPGTKPKACIQFILSDEFKRTADGFKRALFFLSNELNRTGSPEEVRQQLLDWNFRMGSPLREEDILYRAGRAKVYTMSCARIHQFLESVNEGEEARKCQSKN